MALRIRSICGKPTGIIGASIATTGTAMAQQHLRNILAYLDVPVMGQLEVFNHARDGLFDDDGNLGTGSKAFLQSWMDAFTRWVRLHSAQSNL